MKEPTRSAILRISDSKTSELIDLYRNEECLWNTALPSYRDKGARGQANERIAQKLAISHFNGYHVTVKFKNLRNSYCQELKKIANSIQSGASDEDVYKPKVFWFDKIDSFLRPHLQQCRTSNFTVHDEISKDSKESGDGDYVNVKTEPEEPSESGADDAEESIEREAEIPGPAFDFSSDDDDPLLSRRARTSCTPSKRLKTEDHSCSDQSCSVLKSISSQLEALAGSREDTFDSFGRYLAALLRAMPEQRALALQPRIVELVTSAAIKGKDRVSQSGQNN